jgi:hypothetical protein
MDCRAEKGRKDREVGSLETELFTLLNFFSFPLSAAPACRFCMRGMGFSSTLKFLNPATLSLLLFSECKSEREKPKTHTQLRRRAPGFSSAEESDQGVGPKRGAERKVAQGEDAGDQGEPSGRGSSREERRTGEQAE